MVQKKSFAKKTDEGSRSFIYELINSTTARAKGMLKRIVTVQINFTPKPDKTKLIRINKADTYYTNNKGLNIFEIRTR